MPAHRKEQARVLPLLKAGADLASVLADRDVERRRQRLLALKAAYVVRFKDGREDCYRIIVVRADGVEEPATYKTIDEAATARLSSEKTLAQHALITFERAIDLFFATRVLPSGSKAASNVTKKGRMLALFEPVLKVPVPRLTQEAGRALYEGKISAQLGPDGRAQLVAEGYVHRRTKKTGRPPAVDTHHAALKAGQELTQWLLEQGFIAKDLLAGVKPIGQKREGGFGKADLSFEEQLLLDKTCERVLATLHTFPAHRQLAWRQRAVAVIMCLRMGTRTNELLSARRRQVAVIRKATQVAGFFEVTRENAKTGTSTRRLPVPPVVMRHLLPLVEGKALEHFVFSGAPRGRAGRGLGGANWERDPSVGLTERWLANALERLCELAGVRKENPHGLRGAFNDLMRRGGAEIEAASKALGHGSIGITERSYANDEVMEEAAQRRVLEQLGYFTEDANVKGPN